MALFGQMGASYDTVIWYDHEFERLVKFGVPEPRPSIKLIPWMMSRVVNLKQFEKLLPVSLKDVQIYDPLGVSAPQQGELSIGELLQAVTGLWSKDRDCTGSQLHGVIAAFPIYSIERF